MDFHLRVTRARRLAQAGVRRPLAKILAPAHGDVRMLGFQKIAQLRKHRGVPWIFYLRKPWILGQDSGPLGIPKIRKTRILSKKKPRKCRF